MGGGRVPSKAGSEECWGARKDSGLTGDGSLESRDGKFEET